ncbi:uncharacterized protein LOC130725173 [Lotus japonicus]|uniref:uncharacterized protein LOC130725173 n=1 Tax=Lotus japonicus TaxID=34305 RepID=UPI00258C3907|nr:uncharacterized protein LOC130725173 [Lotus japonicus]
MMKEMGFGDKWRTWIEGCISSATLAVLVNGSPTDFFHIEKGLRQGDPLSPLLFNIVGSALSCMLNILAFEQVPCGFNLGNGLVINHIQFTDDTLIFCENDVAQLDRIYEVVEAFLWASGLKVNFDKSQLFGCNIPSERLVEKANSLEVCNGRKRISWVAWEQVCKSQQLGGLCLGFLGWKNRSLLLKWAWRYGKEKDALWRKIVCSKYKLDERFLIMHLVVDGFSGCSVIMQDILKNLLEDATMAKSFRDALFCRLGSGSVIPFWLDPWVEAIPLSQMFPRLFALAREKNALVHELGAFIGSKWCWSVEF